MKLLDHFLELLSDMVLAHILTAWTDPSRDFEGQSLGVDLDTLKDSHDLADDLVVNDKLLNKIEAFL